MKRGKETYPQIRKIEPLIFWRECRFCGREFKGELGYEILDNTKINPQLYYSYCCNECGCGIEDVRLKVITTNLQSPSIKQKIKYKRPGAGSPGPHEEL